METISYTSLRSNLAEKMQAVSNNHTPLLITRKNTEPVVMISLSDFNSYEETAYLLQSPKNRERLLESIQELDAMIASKKKSKRAL